jgi:hypothetical protein
MRLFAYAALALLLAAPSSVLAASSVARSYNWAGYAATIGSYSAVRGSWNVAASSAADTSVAAGAEWVGIGGFDGTGNLIQAGTRTLQASGQTSYLAWYELYPEGPVSLPLPIAPGDVVSVAIKNVGLALWSISFKDTSTGASFATTVHYISRRASAEWIVERPASLGSLVALAPQDTLAFAGLSATRNGKAVTPVTAAAKKLVLIEADGTSLLTPSALAEDGRSFTLRPTLASGIDTRARIALGR